MSLIGFTDGFGSDLAKVSVVAIVVVTATSTACILNRIICLFSSSLWWIYIECWIVIIDSALALTLALTLTWRNILSVTHIFTIVSSVTTINLFF